MKIATVDVFYIEGGVTPTQRTGPFIFLKLTSDDEIVGWGQAANHGAEMTVSAAATLGGWLKDLGEVTIEGAWQQCFKRGFRRGSNGAQMAALGAIDIAMYDLLGHSLSVPVSLLLGGRVRDRIPVYASFMGDTLGPNGEIERVAATLERGFTAVKLHTGSRRKGEDNLTSTVEVVTALRKVWPSREELQIIIDVNSTFTVHEAIRVGRQLEELDVWWFEEPIHAADLHGYRKLQDALDIPVSAGEGSSNHFEFRELIVQAELDILQPNVTTCGGFTTAKKIANLAEAFNRPVSCHNTDPSLMTAANMQFASWARTCTLAQEYYALDQNHPLRDVTPILSKSLRPDKGYIVMSDDPGLGVIVDEERLRSMSTVISV